MMRERLPSFDGIWMRHWSSGAQRWVRRMCMAALPLLTAGSATGAGEALRAFAVTEVAPGNYVHYGSLDERTLENLGDQANIGFIVGERCVAVVDPGGSLAVGQALKAALRRVTDKPVCYVIITHVHPDHFFGAAAFKDDGPVIVGHENLPRALAARARTYVNALTRDLGEHGAGSEVIAPTQLVRGEQLLDLGGRVLRLKAWSPAHTDNDLTVYDESTGTLWLGDLLFVDHTPVVDGTILGFLAVIDELAGLAPAHFVPGHGKTDASLQAALAMERAYLDMIVRETRAAIRGRKTIQEAVDSVGLSASGDWVNFDGFHRRNVTAAYAELEWE